MVKSMWVRRADIRRLQRDRDRAVTRVSELSGMLDQATRELVEARRMIAELSSRPPIVLEAPQLDLAKVLEAMSTLLYPVRDAEVTVNNAQAEEFAKAGAGPQGAWFPDVEFDDYLVAAQGDIWPTRGGWVAGNAATTTKMTDTTPSHAVDETGKVIRLDGTPLFRSGYSAPPPASGTE